MSDREVASGNEQMTDRYLGGAGRAFATQPLRQRC
jgi:hypothetical protein